MALVKCKECGGQVSTTAKACPHCGAKVPKPDGTGPVFKLIVVTSFIVMFVIIGRNDPPTREPTDTDDAFKLCAVMKNTGLTTGCEVDGYDITVTIDTNGAEAREICRKTVEMVAAKSTRLYNGKWQLRIASPYSGDKAIAVCPFG